ncbi:MAG: hypothetical protein QOI93_5352 [Rhodospirillaceae bacterium]|nr:hypothetical protein [Rhodospirillaceae bacterium]
MHLFDLIERPVADQLLTETIAALPCLLLPHGADKTGHRCMMTSQL